MSLQVLASGVSVYEITGTNEDGNPTVVNHLFVRGQILPDWVDQHQQFILVQTGMAAEVGDEPDPRVRPLNQPEAAPVLLPEHSPVAVVGSGVTGFVATDEPVDHSKELDQTTGSQASSGGELASLPEDNATKYAWEAYATRKLPSDQRMTQQEAESMKKADLVAEVKSRYQQAQQQNDDPASVESDPDLPPSY
jgi:hypothetical protein